MAAVAAQPGQRDEHLAAVGDDAGAAGVGERRRRAPGRRPRSSCSRSVAARREQHRGLVDVERLAVPGARQRPSARVARGGRLLHGPTLRPGPRRSAPRDRPLRRRRGRRAGWTHDDRVHHRLDRRHRPRGRPHPAGLGPPRPRARAQRGARPPSSTSCPATSTWWSPTSPRSRRCAPSASGCAPSRWTSWRTTPASG